MIIQRGDDRPSNNFQDNNTGLTPPDPNIIWEISERSDDEYILRNTTYRFYLPVNELLNNSENTRLAKRNRKEEQRGMTTKAPRRQNAWILYRRDKSADKKFQGLKSAQISKEISLMWNEEPQEIKVLFEALSRMAEKRHKEQYGDDYVYKPAPPKKRKTAKEIRKETKTKKKKPTYNNHVFSAHENVSVIQHPMASKTYSSLEEGLTPPHEEQIITAFSPLPQPATYMYNVIPEAEFTASTPSQYPTPPEEVAFSPQELISEAPGFQLTPHEESLALFPSFTMITAPLSLELDQNVLIDGRNNFFSIPYDFDTTDHVCDLSQTNVTQDWTLYPMHYNPREIEDQFSDYTSH